LHACSKKDRSAYNLPERGLYSLYIDERSIELLAFITAMSLSNPARFLTISVSIRAKTERLDLC